MHNPYHNRNAITEPSDFYGRKAEVAKIYSRINVEHPQSISVVGEPKIGKSSLLRFLYNDENKRRHLTNPDDYIYLLVQLQGQKALNPDTFFQSLWSLIQEASGGLIDEIEPSYGGFKRIVEILGEKDKKLIIFLDDFNVITQDESFRLEFFSFLRSIANNYDVAYITSSHLELQKLCVSEDIGESPFFNIFTNVPLKPFKREEMVQLIEEPSRSAGVPLEEHTDFIIDIAGLFPYLGQIACSLLFEIKAAKGEVDSSDLQTVRSRFLEETSDFYESVWNQFKQDERDVCRILLSSKRVRREIEYIARELARRGYLLEDSGKYEFFSSTFKQFVGAKCGVEVAVRDQKRGFFSALRSIFRT